MRGISLENASCDFREIKHDVCLPSAVWRLCAQMSSVFVCRECVIFSLFSEVFILEFDKKVTN